MLVLSGAKEGEQSGFTFPFPQGGEEKPVVVLVCPNSTCVLAATDRKWSCVDLLQWEKD